ncbi:hypothetical protein FOA52_014167 [Chlamydomonas sp. UWO 241]|nr:hypothetical protein FOA52_014167 [Chlamydomonas sp. UWO 241]
MGPASSTWLVILLSALSHALGNALNPISVLVWLQPCLSLVAYDRLVLTLVPGARPWLRHCAGILVTTLANSTGTTVGFAGLLAYPTQSAGALGNAFALSFANCFVYLMAYACVHASTNRWPGSALWALPVMITAAYSVTASLFSSFQAPAAAAMDFEPLRQMCAVWGLPGATFLMAAAAGAAYVLVEAHTPELLGRCDTDPAIAGLPEDPETASLGVALAVALACAENQDLLSHPLLPGTRARRSTSAQARVVRSAHTSAWVVLGCFAAAALIGGLLAQAGTFYQRDVPSLVPNSIQVGCVMESGSEVGSPEYDRLWARTEERIAAGDDIVMWAEGSVADVEQGQGEELLFSRARSLVAAHGNRSYVALCYTSAPPAGSARGRNHFTLLAPNGSIAWSFVLSIPVARGANWFLAGGGRRMDEEEATAAAAERIAAAAEDGTSLPVRLATDVVRFLYGGTGRREPADGGVVSASLLNAKPAVGGIGVKPRGGGVLRVLFTVASAAVVDTVVRWRHELRRCVDSTAVFDILSDREEAQHQALWPAFLAAKVAGKRAQFHRARLVVDGERLSDRFGLLEAVPPEGADAQAEYDAMAAAIREVATNHLAPRGSRRRRGWQFTLSQRTLRLMDARQRAHSAWLRSKSAAAKRERNRANRAADAAVQRDRERWIGQQVAEAQDMLRKKNLRQFARACDRLAGRSRSHQIPPAMRDVSGALHSGPDGVLKAMTESFDKLYGGETKLSDETLNQLENDVAAFELTRATEVDEAHGRPPDLAETEACVRALRSAAAPGGDQLDAMLLRYLKAFPVPFVESDIEPGLPEIPTHDSPFGRLGGATCFDFDHPNYILTAGRKRVDLMLHPSWTWGSVGPRHFVGNQLRSIEGGFTTARCAQSSPASNVVWPAQLRTFLARIQCGVASSGAAPAVWLGRSLPQARCSTSGVTGAVTPSGTVTHQVTTRDQGVAAFEVPLFPRRDTLLVTLHLDTLEFVNLCAAVAVAARSLLGPALTMGGNAARG